MHTLTNATYGDILAGLDSGTQSDLHLISKNVTGGTYD